MRLEVLNNLVCALRHAQTAMKVVSERRITDGWTSMDDAEIVVGSAIEDLQSAIELLDSEEGSYSVTLQNGKQELKLSCDWGVVKSLGQLQADLSSMRTELNEQKRSRQKTLILSQSLAICESLLGCNEITYFSC